MDTTDRSYKRKISDKDINGGKLVHTYSLDKGNYLYSFGTPYQSPYPGDINEYSSGGEIACDNWNDTIIYSFKYFSYLYGYSTKGTIKWVTQLSSFQGFRPFSTVRGGRVRSTTAYSTDLPEKYREVIVSLIPVDSEILMVQTLVNNSDEFDYKTYFISPKTGANLYVSYSLPQIFIIDKNHFYTEASGDVVGIIKYKYR